MNSYLSKNSGESISTNLIVERQVTKFQNKHDYFSDIALWPIQSGINPKGWLKNFSEEEQYFAVQLLNSFMYFSEALVNQMFKAAFHGICNHLTRDINSYLKAMDIWQSFRNSAIITYCTGNPPNPSDSGIEFARKARKQWKIEQNNIKTPEDALQVAYHRELPVIFVDDFVGTGIQFSNTWDRTMKIGAGLELSFSQLSRLRPNNTFYFCPLIITEKGLNSIRRDCPNVSVFPAHILSDRYSVFSSDSLIWPKSMLDSGFAFLKAASHRAKISDDPLSETYWQGFHGLGLTITMHENVPDATLPIFYWNQNGWIPLIEKN